MPNVKMFAASVALVSFGIVPAYPAQRGRSGSHGPSAKHGPSTTSHGPSTTTKGPSPKGTTKPVKVEPTKPVKVDTKVAKADHVKVEKADHAKGGKASTTTSRSTTAGSTTTTPTLVNFAGTSVGQKLSKNTALSSKVATRLQALGYKGTVYQAAYGFKNMGQFVAATNVARNLGISFEQVKLNMTGLSVKPDGTVLRANLTPTGTVIMVDPALAASPAPTKSLGQSIQTVKAGVDATGAAQTATTQANAEIQSTTTSTASTAPTTTSTPTTPSTIGKKTPKKS